MKTLFVIDSAAYGIVSNALREIEGVLLGMATHNKLAHCVYLEVIINSNEVEQFLLNDRFHIKGIQEIYIKH